MPRTLLAGIGRKRELEAIASLHRYDTELAAVALDDLAADGEPEPAAARAALAVPAPVGLEDALAIRGRDRLALALDAELPRVRHADRADGDSCRPAAART